MYVIIYCSSVLCDTGVCIHFGLLQNLEENACVLSDYSNLDFICNLGGRLFLSLATGFEVCVVKCVYCCFLVLSVMLSSRITNVFLNMSVN